MVLFQNRAVLVTGVAIFIGSAGFLRAEVTLKGSLVCNGACEPAPKAEDHVMVLFAIEGTAEIRAEVNRIVNDFLPEHGLDAKTAQKLLQQFDTRLKYYVARDSPALMNDKNQGINHYCHAARAVAVTGTAFEKGGKKWINADKIEPDLLKYPERLLAADTPLMKSDKEPLTLKIGDNLTLKCVYIPPGRFLMGTLYCLWPYYQEEYPHVVTLTKPYYLAEIPVTQEMYQAVMARNPSTVKDPQLPVQNPTFADVKKFCAILSEKNKKTVRLPSDAEWEYAARVGTSNPGLPEKFQEQNSAGPMGFKAPLKVRSKKPNAWGLYDMASCWWEITDDRGMYNVRYSEEDPRHPPASESARTQRSGRGLVKDGWSIGLREFITEKPDYTGQKFRVLVEADVGRSSDDKRLIQ
jgi:formylglycine-generating enzyme required for sulfatase activity